MSSPRCDDQGKFIRRGDKLLANLEVYVTFLSAKSVTEPVIGDPGRQTLTHFCAQIRIACHVRHRLLAGTYYGVHAHPTQSRVHTPSVKPYGLHSPGRIALIQPTQFPGCPITDGSATPKPRGFLLDTVRGRGRRRCTAILRDRHVPPT